MRPMFNENPAAAGHSRPGNAHNIARSSRERASADGRVDFSFAYQPIVDAVDRSVVSYEALVRGPAGEPAPEVLARYSGSDAHLLDERGPPFAIALAVALDVTCDLNLNYLPQSLAVSDKAVKLGIHAAERCGFPPERLVLEVTEGEVIDDPARFGMLIDVYRSFGLKLAIDDFGAGHSGLNLLADFQPDQVKLDMKLIRGIESNSPRQAIVRAIAQVCLDLGIDVIAEGVETADEYGWLAEQQIRLFQGYLFAKPAFAALPTVRYPPFA